MTETVSLLRRLGFAEYEARAYVALLQRSPLNGYELAKSSGVPRADIYSVLQRLEERGAVLRLESEGGTRYSPVPPNDVIGQMESHFKETIHLAHKSLQQVEPVPVREHVWNVEGYEPMLEHARGLIESASRSLLVNFGTEESEALARSLAKAEERGAEITTLCLDACAIQCPNCRGRVYRHRAAPEGRFRWLIVVRDEEEVLAGQVMDEGQAAGVRSRQHMLVQLAAWHIRHSVAVGAVIDDLGSQLDRILQPATLDVLASVGPENSDWLDYMRSLSGSRAPEPSATHGRRSHTTRNTKKNRGSNGDVPL